ncbi:MAG: helix-turn-helix transcriptional regulator [Nanobdellota archaeon]
MTHTRYKKFLLLGIFCSLLIAITALPVFATVLRGDVYDPGLNKISNVVIVVNSDPVQRYVVKNGSYKFELPPGQYKLSARSFDDDRESLGTDVAVTIKKEGSFVSDLVLKKMNESSVVDFDDIKKNESFSHFLEFPISLLAVAILVAIAFLLWKISSKQRSKDSDWGYGFDENTNHLLDIVKSEKRITQKDLRARFDLSEAKISLIISELEKKGIIKRVKKGRGNIIIYQGLKKKGK